MDKLTYKLPEFEGPLDLLLILISKNKLNIYDINISELLEQYMAQINAMKEQDMDIASEFLEMAARLVCIKSQMLLPKHDEGDALREELTGELLEYRVCKEMAQKLSEMTDGFGCFVRSPLEIEPDRRYKRRHNADELIGAYLSAVGRGNRKLPPPVTSFTAIVAKKIVSVSTKVNHVLRSLWKRRKVSYRSLFDHAHSRSELVATFLAVLELIKSCRVVVNGDAAAMSVELVPDSAADIPEITVEKGAVTDER